MRNNSRFTKLIEMAKDAHIFNEINSANYSDLKYKTSKLWNHVYLNHHISGENVNKMLISLWFYLNGFKKWINDEGFVDLGENFESDC